MSDQWKRSSFLSGAGAALAVAGTRPASAANSKALNDIIDGARKEGQLSIVASEGTAGGPNSGLHEGFNKYYGLNIDVRFTPGPAMDTMTSQVIQQVQSKRTPSSDLLVVYGAGLYTAIQANALEAVDWKSWAPNLQQSGLVSSDGTGVVFQTDVMGIAYNTSALKGAAIPQNFRDLLRPNLKGRVATTPYAASFDLLSSPRLWGPDKTLAFAKELGPQLGGLIRCNEMERIASGEFDAFAMTCNQTNPMSVAAKGGPVGFLVAKDAPLTTELYLAIPANAAHPNAAKLWINYMVTREAQDLLYKTELADLSRIKGSKTQGFLRSFEDKGVKFQTINVDFFRTNDAVALKKVQADAVRLFR